MLKNLLLLLLLPILIRAQSFPEKPVNYVTDEAGVLDAQQQSALNSKLKAFEDSTTNQVFVYVTSDIGGVSLTDHCQEIFNTWEIGRKGKDNGVLVAVVVGQKQFRIHTGYGLEGALPDILTKNIQDEVMRPHFKKGDYFTGISEGVDQLIYYSKHEYIPEIIPEKSNTGIIIFASVFLIFCYGINGLFLWAVRSSIKDNEKTSEKTKKIARTLVNIFFYIPFLGAFLMGITGAIFGKRSRRGSGGSGSRSSSWSSSSSSGSSFGGGGGGRSGGGGSSSSW